MTQKPLSTVYYVHNSSYFCRHINTLLITFSRLLTERLASSTCNKYSCLKHDSCMIYLHPHYTSSFKSKTCNIHIFQIHRSTKWHFLSSHIGNSYDSDFAVIYVTKLTGTKVRWTVLRRCSYWLSWHPSIVSKLKERGGRGGGGDRRKYTSMSVFKVT
jgi:hypothetical protein